VKALRRLRAVAILALLIAASPARAADPPPLVIDRAGAEQDLSAAELLARPDAVSLTFQDSVYPHPTTHRAVPLLALLHDISGTAFDTLEARATDGFVTHIPLALIASGASGGAVPWIAVEDPAEPWPALPRQSTSAGPYYLVWEHPERFHVSTEQWPYKLVRLTFTESPVHRWPQLAVPSNVPQNAPARRGQEVFITQCLPCHNMKGGGAAEVGPDLGQPMNPTQYLTGEGLRALIRDPRGVRTWPDQHMMGFDKTALPDTDLNAIIAYLHALAGAAGK
jgi:mono/diheme cytochrome c family protein